MELLTVFWLGSLPEVVNSSSLRDPVSVSDNKKMNLTEKAVDYGPPLAPAHTHTPTHTLTHTPRRVCSEEKACLLGLRLRVGNDKFLLTA